MKTKNAEQRILEIRKKIDDQTEELLQKHLETLDRRIENIINERIGKIVSAALGMEYRFGEWGVDHCNGRRPVIADHIGKFAHDHLLRIIPDYLEKSIGKSILPKDWRKALRKELDDRIHWHLKELVREYAQNTIQSKAEVLLQEALKLKDEPTSVPDEENEYEPLPE